MQPGGSERDASDGDQRHAGDLADEDPARHDLEQPRRDIHLDIEGAQLGDDACEDLVIEGRRRDDHGVDGVLGEHVEDLACGAQARDAGLAELEVELLGERTRRGSPIRHEAGCRVRAEDADDVRALGVRADDERRAQPLPAQMHARDPSSTSPRASTMTTKATAT